MSGDGPTPDERAQVWSAMHPGVRLALVILGPLLILAGVLYQVFGK